jgi:glutaredoxin
MWINKRHKSKTALDLEVSQICDMSPESGLADANPPKLESRTTPPPATPNWRTHVVLYSRHSCHLCDEAHNVLARFELNPIVVDIDADPKLQERFGDCVPVVEIDGRIRFRGRVHPVLLRRQLRHMGP